MRIKFWGVRGSIPTPGRMTEKYGGNTACVEITQGETRIILDGGTGIRELGLSSAMQTPSESALLFSHTHWDHVQGLPFFAPLFKDGFVFRVFVPSLLHARVEAILTRQMEQEVFPVPFTALSSEIRFEEMPENGIEYRGLRINCFGVNHPGGAFGYSICGDSGTIVYATDNEIHRRKHPEAFNSLVEAARGADLLIGDGQYTSVDYEKRSGWGHSTCEEVLAAACEAGVRKLALFHHDPMSDDVAMAKRERILQKESRNLTLFFARDGMAVDVHY